MACSMTSRLTLNGGSLSARITPIACHGPNCDGSFWPPASPANARNALLACDLRMKMRMMARLLVASLGLKGRRLGWRRPRYRTWRSDELDRADRGLAAARISL